EARALAKLKGLKGGRPKGSKKPPGKPRGKPRAKPAAEPGAEPQSKPLSPLTSHHSPSNSETPEARTSDAQTQTQTQTQSLDEVRFTTESRKLAAPLDPSDPLPLDVAWRRFERRLQSAPSRLALAHAAPPSPLPLNSEIEAAVHRLDGVVELVDGWPYR